MDSLKKIGYLVFAFSLIVFAGGTVGFALKKSLPSLFAGSLFGLGLLWTSVLYFTNHRRSSLFAFLLLSLLEGFFAFRFLKTGAIVPAGVMLLLTSLVILSLILLHRKHKIASSPRPN